MADGEKGLMALKTMTKFFMAMTVAALAACGGGGGGADPGTSSAVGSAQELKAKATTSPGLISQLSTVVNTATAGQQTLRAVGALTDGGYAVVWLSANPADAAASSLYTQRYDAANVKVGTQTLLALDLGAIANPAVEMLTDGSVVVAYASTRIPSATQPSIQTTGIYSRRFDATGAAVGTETATAVATQDATSQVQRFYANPTIASWKGGSYVIGWAFVEKSYTGQVPSFQTQRYDAQGVAMAGAQFAIPGAGGDVNTALKLITAGESGLVAATAHRFMGQEYLKYQFAGGAVVGTAFDVDFGLPASATTLLPLSDGRLALWSKNRNGNYLQMLDASANVAGASSTAGALPATAVALGDGGYATLERTTAGDQLSAQRYDASSSAVGAPSLIDTAGWVTPVVAPLTDGFAIAWTTASADSDVALQRFVEADLSGKVKR